MSTKRIWIITLFPEYFEPLKECGVLGRALRNEHEGESKFELNTIQLRHFSPKDYKGVDDAPFGGGVGMVMRPDVLKKALMDGVVAAGGYNPEKIKEELHVVCPAPRGVVWHHHECVRFAKESLSFEQTKDIVFICGRYEGIDERFLEKYVDEFISMGDFILTGGELAVMTILDSAMRFVPGVLGNKLSAVEESFASGKLEHPLYTRPREFDGMEVPKPFIDGNHKLMDEFKAAKTLEMTKKYRPDLL